MTYDQRVIVLDIDDTLYLERDYVRSGFVAVGELVRDRFGCESFGEQCLQLLEQGQRGDIFNQALHDAALPDDQATILGLIEHYRSHYPDIAPLPDAQALLCSGRPLAFISDGPLISQQRKVDAMGLAAVSDTILLTDRWGRAFWKPHRRAFEFVENRFASYSTFTYIGDNPAKDFYAPQELGWQTIRIRRPDGLHRDCPNPQDCTPDFEIESFSELQSLMRKSA